MFENVLDQNVTTLLQEDIQKDSLPNSLLFSGPEGSGKLTCAIETARVLSCTNTQNRGNWNCTCPSCLKHKALIHPNLLIVGSRECVLEIDAAKKTFMTAIETNAQYLPSARYLFIRSIRKLTIRFSPLLWEEDDKLSKISPLIANIDELLEEIDPVKPVPEYDETAKIVDCLDTACKKLEGFLYQSIPIAQIRKAAAWAHLTSADNGKKVLIIENADRMQENVRNALLKILEEPPQDVHFILTTAKRGAVMPTILSRVRTYPFIERTTAQQSNVINRIFHEHTENLAISSYLENYLPVSKETLSKLACSFLLTIPNMPPLIRRVVVQRFNPKDQIPLEMIIGEAHNFEPRILFSLFLKEIMEILRIAVREKGISAQEQNAAMAWLNAIRGINESVSIYNQSPSAALELLSGKLEKIVIY